MYLVVVDGRVVAECLSSATAGGIIQFHGHGMIAEVLYEAQENPAQNTSRRNGAVKKNRKKQRSAVRA